MILKYNGICLYRKLATACNISKYSIDKGITYYNTGLVPASMK